MEPAAGFAGSSWPAGRVVAASVARNRRSPLAARRPDCRLRAQTGEPAANSSRQFQASSEANSRERPI